jgi:ribonuclease HI
MGEGITYTPQNAIKSQVLVDFVTKWTEIQMSLMPIDLKYWTMYFDGSLMKKGASVGLVFVSPHGVRMKYMIHLHFLASNNVAKYEALINGLRITIALGIRWLYIRGDSQLVINQVMKKSSCHNPRMAAYSQEVHKLEDKFNGLELNHISRCLNEAADKLAKMAFGREPVSASVFASDQHKPSVCYEGPGQAGDKPPTSASGARRSLALFDPSGIGSGARAGNVLPAPGSGASPSSSPSDPKVIEIDEDPVGESDEDPAAGFDPSPNWRTPYLDCLICEVLPMDKTYAQWLTRRAKSFVIIEGELYKKSHTKVLQRCIPTEQGRWKLEDIHDGTCGHHAMLRTLIKNMFQ